MAGLFGAWTAWLLAVKMLVEHLPPTVPVASYTLPLDKIYKPVLRRPDIIQGEPLPKAGDYLISFRPSPHLRRGH